MCIYTRITRVFAILILFNIIFIVNAASVRNKNRAQNSEILLNEQVDGEASNPWQYSRYLFEFPYYHGSGVYHDLGGIMPYFKERARSNAGERETRYYRFPIGRCPVFGKVIRLLNNFDFNVTAISEDFSYDKFLDYLKTGKLPGENNPNGLILPVEQLSKVIEKYKGLKSVEGKSSIYECAEHATKFDHPMDSLRNVEHCKNKNGGMCFNHPFIFDTLTHTCYILFPIWQEKRLVADKAESIYRPYKSSYTNFFVFGTSSIESDWRNSCPTKPIKGAAFGLWHNNNCNKIGEVTENMSFNECVKLLFVSSPSDGYEVSEGKDLNESDRILRGKGAFFANWHNNKCEIIEQEPDCLYYSRNNYGLISIARNNLQLYDVPPCIGASQDWEIDVYCGSKSEVFKCKNRQWTNDNNNKLEDCYTKGENLFRRSTEELRIIENKIVLPKSMQEEEGTTSSSSGSSPNISTSTTSKNAKSGGTKSWKNGGIIGSIFFLIICLSFY